MQDNLIRKTTTESTWIATQKYKAQQQPLIQIHNLINHNQPQLQLKSTDLQLATKYNNGE